MARFLILAAGSAIGQSVRNQCLEAGHEVVTTARSERVIKPDVLVDGTDFAGIEAVFRDHGPFDGVVNCAGSLLLRPAHSTSEEQYRAVIDASLTTAFACVRAAGKLMTGGGSVVLVSSAAARQGLANHEAIAAAKGGIEALVRSAAASYATQNLRVNAVAPGLTDTPLAAPVLSSETARKVSESMHPISRAGTPEEVARAIVFLLDPANGWITGQVLGVDGGLSSVRPKPRA